MKDKYSNIKGKGIIKNKIYAILLILMYLSFAFPSILYWKRKKTIFSFNKENHFLLNDVNSMYQAIAYFMILSIIVIFYYLVIKKRNLIFKNMKSVYIYIFIVSAIFILVVPFLSSDIFYYIGIGRLQCKYHENPYYVTMKEYVESPENGINKFKTDTAFLGGYNNCWSNTTVIYGPIWTLICSFLTTLCFGNIDIAIFIFKIANVFAHILIYKLTRRKLFVLLYGLNPFILIEGIGNMHNDLYMLLFTLISLYMILKYNNIWISLIFLSLATNVKFVMILLLPFIVLYYVKNENLNKRIIYCIKYGIFFVVMFLLPYILYYQNISIFFCMLVQREKFSRSLYNYIFLKMSYGQNLEKVNMILKGETILFVIWYFLKCVKLLKCENIKFIAEMRNFIEIIFIFTVFLLTNFQIWYFIWLSGFIMWQKARNIKIINSMQILAELANTIYIVYSENIIIAESIFFELMLVLIVLYIGLVKVKKLIKEIYRKRKQKGLIL